MNKVARHLGWLLLSSSAMAQSLPERLNILDYLKQYSAGVTCPNVVAATNIQSNYFKAQRGYGQIQERFLDLPTEDNELLKCVNKALSKKYKDLQYEKSERGYSAHLK